MDSTTRPRDLPVLEVADASFVTEQLLVGGDLGTQDEELAVRQLQELVDAGVTHLVDTRIEWDDEAWVAERSPEIVYRHHGMDDAGQEVPLEWFDEAVGSALEAIEGGGIVLAHCHMGVNRGPSLGLAVLLAQGWDVDRRPRCDPGRAAGGLGRLRRRRPALAPRAQRVRHAARGRPRPGGSLAHGQPARRRAGDPRQARVRLVSSSLRRVCGP